MLGIRLAFTFVLLIALPLASRQRFDSAGRCAALGYWDAAAALPGVPPDELDGGGVVPMPEPLPERLGGGKLLVAGLGMGAGPAPVAAGPMVIMVPTTVRPSSETCLVLKFAYTPSPARSCLVSARFVSVN